MRSSCLRYILFTLWVFFSLFIGTSLFLSLFSFVVNGLYISLDEIKEIVVFCFKGYAIGSPFASLSLIISDKLRK
jgi:hypothetical protein